MRGRERETLEAQNQGIARERVTKEMRTNQETKTREREGEGEGER